MIIKIEDIRSTLVSSEDTAPAKHRDISWLCIDAKVYSWAMMGRDDVDAALRENVDHCIMEPPRLLPVGDKPVEMQLDEVCMLTIHDPLQITVLFNTRAYICNERGDTIETIAPKRLVKGPIEDAMSKIGAIADETTVESKCSKPGCRTNTQLVNSSYCKECKERMQRAAVNLSSFICRVCGKGKVRPANWKDPVCDDCKEAVRAKPE